MIQVISADAKGLIRYWGCESYSFPVDRTDFTSMFATDLMACAKAKCIAKTICVSPNGALFALVCSDSIVRVFDFKTGKCKSSYDETFDVRYPSIGTVRCSFQFE